MTSTTRALSLSLPAAACLIFCADSPAQWSANPATPLAIGDRSGEQNQPKISPTPDGGAYISWFDNSTGGYDVYLQRVNARGIEQWAHNGILIADRAVSSTVDYDLTTDGDGNAIIVYNDDGGVAGTPQQIVVQKVSPAGNKLWGDNGVTVSSGSAFKGNPHAAALTDGSYIVGYSDGSTSPSGWTMQKLDADGAPQWTGSGFNFVEAGRYTGLSDLIATDNGTFVALWLRAFTTSSLSSKYLYAQKYDGNGAPLWPSTVDAGANAVGVYAPAPSSPWPGGGGNYGTQGGSVQNGYFPSGVHDGSGGAVFGWHENAGPRHAYVQHILADGTVKLAANGAYASDPNSARIRVGSAFAYNQTTGEYFVACADTNASNQSDTQTLAQRFDSSGNRLWGNGVTIIPTGTGNQPSFLQCLPFGGGCMVFGFDSRSGGAVVFGARVNPKGTIAWSTLPCSIEASKSRLVSAIGTRGFAVLAFGNGGGSANDILAVNVNRSGSSGFFCPADWNEDGAVNSGDVTAYLNDWFSDLAGGGWVAQFNDDLSVNSGDVTAFLSAWFADLAGGC